MRTANLLLLFFITATFSATAQDPSATIGSTGTVSFNYLNAPVTYSTVRAADGVIWSQQTLGASRVALTANDASAYGDLFQWGRWDDSGQLRTAAYYDQKNLSSNNPLGLNGGMSKFLSSSIPPPSGNGITVSAIPSWWPDSLGSTWSGTNITAHNGKDPCTAMGTGWRLPTLDEWYRGTKVEGIHDTASGIASHLKLTVGGQRQYFGLIINLMPFSYVGSAGYYWSSTVGVAVNSNSYGPYYVGSFFIQPDTTALPASVKSWGESVRCIKKVPATVGCTGMPMTPFAITPDTTNICSAGTLVLKGVDPNTTVTGITYQWQQSSTTTGTYTAVTSGTGGTTLTYITPAPAAATYYRLAATCGANTAISSSIPITITQTTIPASSIAASANPVCDGSPVTLQATVSKDTGTNPVFGWYVNRVNVGAAKTYSYIPSTNDTVYFVTKNTVYCASTWADTTNKIIITVNPLVTPTTAITVSPNDTICAGTPVTIATTSTNGGTTPTYQWKKNNINVATGNTYTYTPSNNDTIVTLLTSNNPCTTISEATSNKIFFHVIPTVTPTITITTTPSDTVCEGTPLTFASKGINGGNAPRYTWLKNGSSVANGTTYSYTPANGDQISCKLNSNVQCAIPDSVIATHTIKVNPLPTKPIINNNNGELTVSGIYATYQWTINNQPIPGATSSNYPPDADGTYSVIVTDANDCNNTSDPYQYTLGIESVGSIARSIKIYPNPGANVIFIQAPLAINTHIYSIDGKQVMSIDNAGEININALSPGMYIVRVLDKTGNILKTEKLIKIAE